MDRHSFRGIYAIPVTPFTADLDIDEAARLRATLKFCMDAGVHGLVANANISEVAYLSDEREEADGHDGRGGCRRENPGRYRCIERASPAVRRDGPTRGADRGGRHHGHAADIPSADAGRDQDLLSRIGLVLQSPDHRSECQQSWRDADERVVPRRTDRRNTKRPLHQGGDGIPGTADKRRAAHRG